MVEDIREAALRYHCEGRPGKIEVIASKPLGPILVRSRWWVRNMMLGRKARHP
jgi:hypothetical protein